MIVHEHLSTTPAKAATHRSNGGNGGHTYLLALEWRATCHPGTFLQKVLGLSKPASLGGYVDPYRGPMSHQTQPFTSSNLPTPVSSTNLPCARMKPQIPPSASNVKLIHLGLQTSGGLLKVIKGQPPRTRPCGLALFSSSQGTTAVSLEINPQDSPKLPKYLGVQAQEFQQRTNKCEREFWYGALWVRMQIH